jgi:hypothetical protein
VGRIYVNGLCIMYVTLLSLNTDKGILLIFLRGRGASRAQFRLFLPEDNQSSVIETIAVTVRTESPK